MPDRGPPTLKRFNQLIQDIARNSSEGIREPESLKQGHSGYWSRRITDEHRLVYKVVGEEIRIASCRYHYLAPERPHDWHPLAHETCHYPPLGGTA